jgi:hypothetical protein
MGVELRNSSKKMTSKIFRASILASELAHNEYA